MNVVDPLLADRVATALLHFIWQGMVIAAVASVLLALPGTSSRIRYAIGVLCLTAMLVCPVVTMSIANQSVLPSALESFALNDTSPTGGLSEPASVRDTPLPSADPTNDATSAPSVHWIVGLWMAGVTLLSLRLVASLFAINRIRRRGDAVPVRVMRSVERIAGALGLHPLPRTVVSGLAGEPLAVCFFRPMIVLPAAWLAEVPADVLEAAIAHELAHIRRYDLWVNLFQRVVETLLFYHPAVWWLSGRVRLERELCCDELAVRATGQRVAYARALEFVARRRLQKTHVPLTTGFGGKRMAVLKRVRHVLGVESPNHRLIGWPAGIAILMLLLSGVTAAVATNAYAGGNPSERAMTVILGSLLQDDEARDEEDEDDADRPRRETRERDRDHDEGEERERDERLRDRRERDRDDDERHVERHERHEREERRHADEDRRHESDRDDREHHERQESVRIYRYTRPAGDGDDDELREHRERDEDIKRYIRRIEINRQGNRFPRQLKELGLEDLPDLEIKSLRDLDVNEFIILSRENAERHRDEDRHHAEDRRRVEPHGERDELIHLLRALREEVEQLRHEVRELRQNRNRYPAQRQINDPNQNAPRYRSIQEPRYRSVQEVDQETRRTNTDRDRDRDHRDGDADESRFRRRSSREQPDPETRPQGNRDRDDESDSRDRRPELEAAVEDSRSDFLLPPVGAEEPDRSDGESSDPEGNDESDPTAPANDDEAEAEATEEADTGAEDVGVFVSDADEEVFSFYIGFGR